MVVEQNKKQCLIGLVVSFFYGNLFTCRLVFGFNSKFCRLLKGPRKKTPEINSK